MSHKTISFILFLSILCSCVPGKEKANSSCQEVSYKESSKLFEITKRVIFDTTANLFHAKIVDESTGSPIIGADLTWSNGITSYQVITDTKGEAEVFKDNFSGTWQLKIVHTDYFCLLMKDVQIDGGQWAIIRLRRR